MKNLIKEQVLKKKKKDNFLQEKDLEKFFDLHNNLKFFSESSRLLDEFYYNYFIEEKKRYENEKNRKLKEFILNINGISIERDKFFIFRDQEKKNISNLHKGVNEFIDQRINLFSKLIKKKLKNYKFNSNLKLIFETPNNYRNVFNKNTGYIDERKKINYEKGIFLEGYKKLMEEVKLHLKRIKILEEIPVEINKRLIKEQKEIKEKRKIYLAEEKKKIGKNKLIKKTEKEKQNIKEKKIKKNYQKPPPHRIYLFLYIFFFLCKKIIFFFLLIIRKIFNRELFYNCKKEKVEITIFELFKKEFSIFNKELTKLFNEEIKILISKEKKNKNKKLFLEMEKRKVIISKKFDRLYKKRNKRTFNSYVKIAKKYNFRSLLKLEFDFEIFFKDLIEEEYLNYENGVSFNENLNILIKTQNLFLQKFFNFCNNYK